MAEIRDAIGAVQEGGAKSPAAIALGRFWRSRSARLSCYAVLAFLLLGVYAPIIASDAALIWWDESGFRVPVLGDLFNVWSYPERHDLLFNLVALLLPLHVVAWFLLRRWLTVPSRLLVLGAITAALWVLCQLPLFQPLSEGGDRRAVWDRRPLTPYTYRSLQHLREIERDGAIAAVNGDVLYTAQDEAVEVVAVDHEAAIALVRPVGVGPGGERSRVPVDELRTPERTLLLFPPVPHDYSEPFAGGGLLRPGAINPVTGNHFWLGTDLIGRDILALMLFGARISMTIGLLSTGIAMVIGVIVGATSGYFGGWVDLVLQRIVEIMMTFPTFILILIVVSIFGRNIFFIIAVIGLVGWADTARLTRGEFLSQMRREYVLACQSLGLPRWRIMFRHILPNAMTPLLIAASFSIAGAVLAESGLAFLGLVESTTPSWGLILNSGRDKIEYPHLLYAPGIAIFVLVYTLNIIGNGLREAFDPKAAGR